MRLAIPTILLIALIITPALASRSTTDIQRRSVDVVTAMIDAAEPGAVIAVPPGIYEGNLVVRKQITLDGERRAVFDGKGRGSVIEVLAAGAAVRHCLVRNSGDDVTGEPAGIRVIAADVTIESNVIEDTLFGIDLRESPNSAIRFNTVVCKDLEPGRRGDGIRLWWSHGSVIEGNVVRNSRDMVFWYSENLQVARNTVTDSRYGLHFMYSHDTVLESNELIGNSVGVYLMYSNRIELNGNRMRNNRGASGYGIGLKDCDDISIEGNAMLSNRVGIYIDNSPSSVGSSGLFASNMIAFNEIGLLATPNTHDNIFTGNAFIENEETAATHGRGQLTSNAFSHNGTGNYWSDYAGFDLDGDGIGDMAYEPKSLFGAMLAREPNLRLFIHSPVQRAIEFTMRAFPELQPHATLIDHAPLAVPPRVEMAIPVTTDSSLKMAALAAGFLASALGVICVLGRELRLGGALLGAHA